MQEGNEHGQETDPLLPKGRDGKQIATWKSVESLRSVNRRNFDAAFTSHSEIDAEAEDVERRENPEETSLLVHERASRLAGRSYWAMGDPDTHRHRTPRRDDGEASPLMGSSYRSRTQSREREGHDQLHSSPNMGISVYDEGQHIVIEDERNSTVLIHRLSPT